MGEGAARAAGFLYDGLYRLDERLRPVPALAREPATVSPDGRIWTLTLRDDVRFHDGSPLTADDVVQTYAIARSQRCRFGRSTCLSAVLEDVTKVDERTVAFTLVRPLAAFATTYLGIWIDSKAAVDRSFATFLDGIEGVAASETATFLRAVAAEEAAPTGPDDASGRPTVDYTQFREPGEALLAKAGLSVPQPADPAGAGDSPDVDAYVLDIVGRVRAIDASFTSTSIDALAAAYPYLDLWDAPVGTGPFRFVSRAAAGELELAANDAYFAGVPQVERLDLLVAAGSERSDPGPRRRPDRLVG